jgi:hypothetical protein
MLLQLIDELAGCNNILYNVTEGVAHKANFTSSCNFFSEKEVKSVAFA